jgi:RNA recognition motif-containing protein
MATGSHAALLLHVYSFQRSGLVFTSCALQPNKVYIGGLPENTRQEDLQSCFGKIGEIVNIELKYVSRH